MVNPEGHVVVGHAQCRSGHDVNRGEVFGIEVDRQWRDGILKSTAAVENDLGRCTHARENASRAAQEADGPDERRQRTSFRHHRGDRRGRRTDDVVAGATSGLLQEACNVDSERLHRGNLTSVRSGPRLETRAVSRRVLRAATAQCRSELGRVGRRVDC